MKKKDNKPDNINLSKKQVATKADSDSPVSYEKTKSEKKSSDEKNNASTSRISLIIKFMVKSFLLVTFLASVFAIIFGGQEIYNIRQQQIEDRKLSKQYHAHIDALYSQINKDKEIIRERYAQLDTIISSLKESVTDNSSRLGEISFPRQRSTLLAEAEYLIWLAETYIVAKNSPKKIAEIFLSVDTILGKLKFFSAQESREAVTTIISVLRSTSIVDRENIYSKLSLMIDQLDQLPLIQPVHDSEAIFKTTSNISEPEQLQWQEKISTGVYNVLARFKDLVRIKEYKNPPNLVSPQEKRQQLIRRLKSIFGQTQISLLLEEDGIYKKSLKKTKTILLRDYSEHEELIK
ncbi:MAG: hypothetical protein HOK73_02915, partial [Cellvibrionales bacterium]|nr:hypothetical protein [Cellvibrionales bacterium]